MGIHTKLEQDELHRKKEKSPAIQSNSTKSFISAVSKRRQTNAKSVFRSKVQAGYVEYNADCLNSDLGLNCNFKLSGKYRQMKLTTDISGKNKKRQFSEGIVKNDMTYFRVACRNKKHEEKNRPHKLGNFKVEDNVTDLKLKHRNKEHGEAIRIQKINTSKEDDATNLKQKRKNKEHKGAVRIKKVSNSKIESNIKLEHKCSKKSKVEALGIEKLNDSVLAVCADASPDGGLRPSDYSRVGNSIKFELKCRNNPHQEAVKIQKSNNSEQEEALNLKLKYRNKQHKGTVKTKKLNSSKFEGTVQFEHKRRNMPQKEAIRIQKLSNSKKEVSTNFKLRCRNKQHKGAVKIKKLNNSKVKRTIKLGYKHRKKPKEEDIGSQELKNSEVTIPASTVSVAVQKPSHTLMSDKVKSSVSAMLQLRDAKTPSKPMSLFMDAGQPVYLVVQCIRIPKMYNQHFRFCLPHPLIDKSSDVCLFVPDLKKGKNEDHEPTVEHYKDLLEKNYVTGVSQVMPLRQVRVEYDQYELRRRLVSQFDLFLSDGRIAGHMLHLLGKEVYKRRKLPVPVNMKAKNLKDEFETALRKTLMMMNAQGNKAAVRVGHTKQSVTQIAENIMAVAECLAEHYPGGWDNIRTLHIHLQDSALIPVYITLKSSNEVKVPVVKPVVPKKARPVEGELTTFPGTHVTVMPSGEVLVKKMERTKDDEEMGLSDSDWDEYNSDEEMDVDDADETPTVPIDDKTEVDPQPDSEEEKESEDSDDGNEQVAEAAEDAYLSEWSKQWNENIQENKKRKQSEANNEAKGEPEKKKKLKLVKSKNKRQKVTEDKSDMREKKKSNKRVLQ